MQDAATTIYEGHITSGQECEVVRIDGGGTVLPFHPRTDLHSHSPGGFAWGYGGSGPAQLALAILADHLRDDARALRPYQDFKWNIVARLEQKSGWTLTREAVEDAVAELEAEHDAESVMHSP